MPKIKIKSYKKVQLVQKKARKEELRNTTEKKHKKQMIK